MVKAWEEYKKSNYKIYIQDLLDPNFETRLKNIRGFESFITKGEASVLVNKTIDFINTIASKFGLKSIDSIINDKIKFIDIFEEAYSNIYQKFEVDKFRCDDNKTNDPYISEYEYHFETLKQFVDCLKRSDNCFVYARIDSIFDYEDKNNYDTIFAFGCRYGNYVYINSDRPYHATSVSRAIKMNRNPKKELRNKADSSWMPYYAIQQGELNKEISSETALVEINPKNSPATRISDIYDDPAKLIICLSIAAMYQKYVINKVSDIRYNHTLGRKEEVQDNWFGEEIKLLPSSTCTAITLPGNLQLPTPLKSTLAINNPKVSQGDVSFYDWYFKEYITENDLQEPIEMDSFLGNKEEAEIRIWWLYRTEARKLINKRRTEDILKEFWDLDQLKLGNKEDIIPPKDEYWEDRHPLKVYNSKLNIHMNTHKTFNFLNHIAANYELILKECLARPSGWDGWHSQNRYYLNNKKIDSPKHVFGGDHIIADNLFNSEFRMDSTDLYYSYDKYGHKYYSPKSNTWNKKDVISKNINGLVIETDISKNSFYLYYEDSQTKQHEFKIRLNSVWDLAYIFGCKREELPKCFNRWLNNSCNFKPYTGNCILDVTDPMEDVVDIMDANFTNVEVKVYLSTRELNRLTKLYNITWVAPKKGDE